MKLVPRNQQRWNYGFKLVDPDPNNAQAQAIQARCGMHLCQVVTRCLMNNQEHRPTLQQLQDWATAAWKTAVFGNPRAPTIPWQLNESGISNSDINPFMNYATGRAV